MFEPSFAPAAADDAENEELQAPATPDPYGDVALGVECAWPMALET